MHQPKRRAPLALALALLLPGPAHAAGQSLFWKKQPLSLDALPATFEPATRDALEVWEPWARANGYRIHLSDDGSLLLALSEKRRAKREEELFAKTVAAFEGLLPRRPPAPPVDARTPASEARAEGESEAEGRWSWGEELGDPRASTAVLLVLQDEDDLLEAARHLGERQSSLRGWASSLAGQSGFLLERPLVGAFVLTGEGLEEYSPDHELVHRATQLLLLQHSGRQPDWLQLGLPWLFEERLLGGIWCFPARTDFVLRGEHADWDRALKNRYKKARALSAEEVLGLRRTHWESERAQCAFGLVAHLARNERHSFAALVQDFGELRRARSVVTHADGSWEWLPDLELSRADQVELLEKRLGERWLEELLAAWQKGKL